MSWNRHKTINDLTDKEYLAEVTDGTAKCEGTDALAWLLVKLDRFSCQGWGGTSGASGYLGPGSWTAVNLQSASIKLPESGIYV